MIKAKIFGWPSLILAASLCVLAAPALAAPPDDVNLLSLSPPSGTLAGVRRGEVLGPVNSVEATIRYRLQSTLQGFITINGEPFTTYPTTMSPLPVPRFSNGNGDVRIRFSWLCNDRSPSSNPLPAITITMRGVDARGVGTGVLVQKTQSVNYTFTCRPPSLIKRPSDATLTAPGKSPMQRLSPQARGSLLPADLVPTLTDPMTDVVRVRNLGPGPAAASALTVSCMNLDPKAKVGFGCPTTAFPLQSGGGHRYVLIEIPALAPSAEHVVTLRPWPSTWPVGRYRFQAQANHDGRVRENDGTNNVATSYLQVQ